VDRNSQRCRKSEEPEIGIPTHVGDKGICVKILDGAPNTKRQFFKLLKNAKLQNQLKIYAKPPKCHAKILERIKAETHSSILIAQYS